jgi:TetR/AcrR family transcriptional regulator
MPQETFFNLPDDKRNQIISAAMDEFSKADYNTASVNQICNKSNIA